MAETMVELEGVSMSFRLEQSRTQSLKGFVVAALQNKLRYEQFQALTDVGFSVAKGEVIGIVGRNGAGKSTLLKCIAGIMIPTAGSVRVSGNIVPMLELGSGFDFELTGRENIFLNGAILGYSKAYLKQKYSEIVSFSELGRFIESPIRTYSSGMMMRLAFSIAAVVDPEILIVDEILSVGDSDFQEKSYARMREMMGGGTTVFFVSHSIDRIESFCNRVVWLEQGRVKMIGETERVCSAYKKS